ncbi:MAG: hypothetical protein ACK5KO_04970 [Arachnia sp.]
MALVNEFVELIRRSSRLWWRYLPQAGAWLVASWAFYQASVIGSAMLGSTHQVLAMIVLGLGVVVHALGLIFAIASLRPALTSPEAIRARGASSLVPPTVLAPERPIDMALNTMGPVLGIYAVWGVVDELVRTSFIWNLAWNPLGMTQYWSVSLNRDQLGFYVALGAASLVCQRLWMLLVRRKGPWWRVPTVILEGLWTLSSFFIILIGVGAGLSWLDSRNLGRWVVWAWHGFLSWLPEIALPFGLTLPEAMSRLVAWLQESLLPAAWEGLLLPLMWLVVTAMVFGWRDFRFQDLMQQQTWQRLARFAPSGDGPVVRLFGMVTADLREKYVPALHSFRLIWSAGPYVLGAYVVLMALVDRLEMFVMSMLLRWWAVGDDASLIEILPVAELVTRMITMGISIPLFVATFDRAIMASGQRPTGRARAPQPPNTSAVGYHPGR